MPILGDLAFQIENETYIQNLCEIKANDEFEEGIISCEVLTNPQGVKYAKIIETVPIDPYSPDSEFIDVSFYYIYNPYSSYRGIIISSERFIKENIENIEPKIEVLVDSFAFIEPNKK